MAERCVICGKKYKRSITAAHLKSHGISSRKYKIAQNKLTRTQWRFYWKNEKIQAMFPDALADLDEPVKGFSSYSDWVQNRYPEL